MSDYEEPAKTASPAKSKTSSPAPKPKPKPAVQVDRAEAEDVVRAAADIVQHQRSSFVKNASGRFRDGLMTLYAGVVGSVGDQKLQPKDRLAKISVGLAMIAPATNLYRKDQQGAEWLAKELDPYVERIRSSARFDQTMQRVDNSMRIGNQLVELPEEGGDPRRQGKLLSQEIEKLIPMMTVVNEQVIRMGEVGIHHKAQELMHGHHKDFGPGTLVELQALLWTYNGLLTMTDEEFHHHLKHPKGTLHAITSYGELVKAAIEAAAGAVTTTAAFAAVVGKAIKAPWAPVLAGCARNAALGFSQVITCIEIVRGSLVLLDSNATRQEKIDAAVNVSSNTLWLVGAKVGSVGAMAGSIAIMLGYAELKLALTAFWETSVAINEGMIRLAFETLQRDGNDIAQDSERLTKTQELIAAEKDQAKREELQRVERVLVERVGGHVDYLLNDLAPRGFESGIARHPGAYPILVEIFSSLKGFRGARDKAKVMAAARLALEKLAWTFSHADDVIVSTVKRQSLADVKHDIDKRENDKKGHH